MAEKEQTYLNEAVMLDNVICIPLDLDSRLEQERIAREAHHAAVHLHEQEVAASYDWAVALNPSLTCIEWANLNPFPGRAGS